MEKKTLLLIRHAKSSWSNPDLSDFDRPLNNRGERDAPIMGDRLSKRDIYPDKFLSSSAKRAKKTARKIALKIAFPKNKIVFTEDLYHAGEEEVLTIIKGTDESLSTLFLVGHNYTLTDLSNFLTSTYIENIPTTGMVAIDFYVKWTNIGKGKGTLRFFDYPKLEPKV